MNQCPKCGRETFQTHSEESCTYFSTLQTMKEKKYVSMNSHPNIEELLETNLPVVRHRWPIDVKNPLVQGYVEHIFMPHWVEKAANLYNDSNYGGMNLAEFMEKMTPV